MVVEWAAMHTPTQGGRFATTRWSVVVAAGRNAGDGDHDDGTRREALETLCRTYWYPLYVYARRKGHAPEHAADLVQGFFTSLLERQAVARADRQRGRFRSFLLASFDHYMANEHRRATAQKRGGGAVIVGLDFDDGERRYGLEPSHHLTPDRVYERRWALTVLARAVGSVAEDTARRGRGSCLRS